MKKMITAVAIVALSSTLAMASPYGGGGEGHGRGGRHGQMDQKFAEKLNLSDAQKQQIRDMRHSFRDQNKAFFDSVRATREQLRAARQSGDTAKAQQLAAQAEGQRAQMQELRKAEHEKMLTILTPEQRTQLEQMKADRQAKREQWKQNHAQGQKDGGR
jgi:protein CpxP